MLSILTCGLNGFVLCAILEDLVFVLSVLVMVRLFEGIFMFPLIGFLHRKTFAYNKYGTGPRIELCGT